MVGGPAIKWPRWIARGLGTLAGAWWLLAVLVIANVAGVALAWWRERLGGAILALAGAALCLFAYVTAGHNKGFAVLVSGAPFTVSGVLFLVSSERAKTPSS